MLAVQFEGLCDDGITVIVVENHEVIAAATGRERETTCLVCGDLAGDFDGIQEFHFGSEAGLWGRNGRSCHFWRIVVYVRGSGDPGGPNIFSLLAKMTLGGCKRLGKMFADELRNDAGPNVTTVVHAGGTTPPIMSTTKPPTMYINRKLSTPLTTWPPPPRVIARWWQRSPPQTVPLLPRSR